ncbi:Putative GTP-binding protein YdgA [Salmonella bongori]|nr:Putative GTP-binding protein YdgA [Salmonella bongori]
MDMAVEFMTQIAKLEGYQQDDAEKLAKQQVQGLSAMGQMFRLTTLKDNTIASSLQYANGQVTLNGQKMPLEDFVGLFGMPTLSVSGRSGAAATVIVLPGVAPAAPGFIARYFGITSRRLSFDFANGARREQYAVTCVQQSIANFPRRRAGPDNRQVVRAPVLRRPANAASDTCCSK